MRTIPSPHLLHRARYAAVLTALLGCGTAIAGDAELVGRAVLPADTFRAGPTSGQQLGTAPINGFTPPFINRQPVQGFSAVHDNRDGSFLVMCDNGFGAMENSSDFELRVYRIRLDFRTTRGGSGGTKVLSHIALHDPNCKIPFAIANHFSKERILTGADFDIESMQRAPDGSLWFGDEFGPCLLRTDGSGRVLNAPFQLPDVDRPGKFVRSPQNQFSEEASAVRVMNAMRNHARSNGNQRTPVFSPFHVMLVDGNDANDHYARGAVSPTGSGLAPALSDIHDIGSLLRAGYAVVPYTVNDPARMRELMTLKVSGLISDRPDLLFAAVAAFDADGNGVAGDLLDANGLIDPARFDAQGHRGGRNLRPENTLPAMEVALDNLMTTLETDCGITRDFVAVLCHDPHITAQTARRSNGASYAFADEVLIKDLTLAEIQRQFIVDKLFRGVDQKNDRALFPVAVDFAARRHLPDPYVMPTLQQLFDFVQHYVAHYRTGAGSSHPAAAKRALNASRVRFNIETKINPRHDRDNHGQVFAERTKAPIVFSLAVGGTIAVNRLQQRADIQSFDFRTLLQVHAFFPAIRTVCLFGDFPIYADRSNPDSDDGTNLQDEDSANTPWLAGLPWRYRITALSNPFRAAVSGGFEGMALTHDRRNLLPLLERPLAGDDAKTLLIHVFNLATRSYTGERHRYRLDARGTNIGDFIMTSPRGGLVIERDGTQGNLAGYKRVFAITTNVSETFVDKVADIDLLRIADPHGISLPGRPGDIGLGTTFAFPFVTIEDVVLLGRDRIGVLNDNNFPFSTGRNPGRADDNEFIVLQLPEGTVPRGRE